MSNLPTVNTPTNNSHSTTPAVQSNAPALLQWLQDPEKRELCKRSYCVGATDDEFELFLLVCQRTMLDPFRRQIYAIKRWDSNQRREVMAYQTSIDGFRLIAQRTNLYEGQIGPFWCGEDGQWREVWLAKTPPAAAKVGILRKGFREPLWAVARFDSYKQVTKDGKVTRMWHEKGDIMIAKCAESLGLRKAFPDDLSGLYSEDEMAQADNGRPSDEPKDVTPPASRQISPPKTDAKPQASAPSGPAPERKAESRPGPTPKPPPPGQPYSRHVPPGEFVIPQWTYQGRRLDSIPEEEIRRYLDKQLNGHIERGLEIPPFLKILAEKIDEHFGKQAEVVDSDDVDAFLNSPEPDFDDEVGVGVPEYGGKGGE